jgi:hypothetical protein
MRTAIDPTLFRLVRDISEGIRVLATRDGVPLTENQILDRASNIVMGLVGNYRIQSLDAGDDVDLPRSIRSPEPSGPTFLDPEAANDTAWLSARQPEP